MVTNIPDKRLAGVRRPQPLHLRRPINEQADTHLQGSRRRCHVMRLGPNRPGVRQWRLGQDGTGVERRCGHPTGGLPYEAYAAVRFRIAVHWAVNSYGPQCHFDVVHSRCAVRTLGIGRR